jgi:hypothetical protein
MINKNEAKEIVEKEINEPDPYWPDRPRLLILDDATIEKDWGWVFFYDTERHIGSGDFKDAVAGNAPYIVNKRTGKTEVTGTALPIENFILEYERKLNGRV